MGKLLYSSADYAINSSWKRNKGLKRTRGDDDGVFFFFYWLETVLLIFNVLNISLMYY